MQTDELIQRLVADTGAVRRLKSPWWRAIAWLALALPYVAVVAWVHLASFDAVAVVADPRFMIEQAAGLATALTAAFAAFASVVPGFDRRALLLPLAPLALWLASIGQGCVEDWLQLGPDGLSVRPDWDCLPAALIIGAVPAAVLFVMLRRGAPLHPRVSLALAALAVAAVSNLGMQVFHFRDASVMLLVWHLGGMAAISLVAGSLGGRVLRWRHAKGVR
ncbi:MAG: DUF1109 family protein [Hyphomicrobiaceae bacterium]|nr:DUF1109 family protein [Hyphomicrobiaceae bacterium]